MPVGPYTLWPVNDIEIAIQILHVDGQMHRALGTIEQDRNATLVGKRTTSLAGTTMVPSTFDIWVNGDHLWCAGVSSFSNSSIRNSPSSETGAHLSTAPLRSRMEVPGNDIGVMLHDR